MTRSTRTSLPSKIAKAAAAAALAVAAGAGAAPAPAAAAPAMFAGVFQIQNWGGDYHCLNGSPAGGPVTAVACDLEADDQLWWRTNANEFVPWQGAIGPYYCLSANASNVVSLQLCSGSTQHVWTQVNETMRNSASGRCLTAGAANRVTTAVCSGAADQKWRLFGS